MRWLGGFCVPALNSTEWDRIAPLLDAPHSHFREAGGPQRGRKLQRLMFCYKPGPRRACNCICHDEYSTSITDGPSSGERGKPEQMDAASARTFDTMVRVAGVVVRDGLAHPLLLTGHGGTALGVHAGRAETLQ